MTGPQPSTSTTGDSPAQQFYDSVLAKTGNRNQAIKATTQKFGPPTAEPTVDPMARDATAQPDQFGYQAPPMTMGQEIGNIARQGAQTASFGFGDDIAGMIGGPQARENWNQKLAQGKIDSPLGSMLGMGVGMFSPAKLFGTIANGTVQALTRLTPLSAKTANIVAQLTSGALTGTVSSAGNAQPGQRLEHVGRDALLGAGTAGAFAMVQAISPLLDKFSGILLLQPKARQQITDMMVLDQLAATNQTVGQAMNRAEQLIALGSKPNVGAAIGPASIRMLAPRQSPAGNLATRGVAAGKAASMGAETNAIEQSTNAIDQHINAMQSVLKGGTPQGTAQQGASKAQLAYRAEQFPSPPRAMQIATQDMGLSAQEARETIKLAQEIVESRKQFADALLALSKRDPVTSSSLMSELGTGSNVLGGTLSKVVGAIFGPLGRATERAQVQTTLETLLKTDPLGYLKQLQSLQGQAGKVAAMRSVTQGGFAGQIPATALRTGQTDTVVDQ